jgi:hypothetical protein
VSHDEYLLYSTLFNISDVADCRSMSMSVFSTLLQFTTIPETTRTAFVDYFSRGDTVFSVPLELEDWIVSLHLNCVYKIVSCLLTSYSS